MTTLGARIHYRPVRIGWCIRDGNWDDLRLVLRLTHAFWGGRFNPIIPVGCEVVAHDLVRAFRVDVLYPASDHPSMKNFVDGFPWLRWPPFEDALFVRRGEHFHGDDPGRATFLDIYHPVRQIAEDSAARGGRAEFKAASLAWPSDDPLSDVFCASFGAYPSKAIIGIDYAKFLAKALTVRVFDLSGGADLPAEILNYATPSDLTKYNLHWDRVPKSRNPGFYVGNSNDFHDIVGFWNLRASDVELFFFDPKQSRLQDFRDGYVKMLNRRPRNPSVFGDRVAIWSKDGKEVDPAPFGGVIFMPGVDDLEWSRLNLPLHYIGEDQSVLGSVTDDGRAPVLALQLPGKPFFSEPDVTVHQRLVVSVACKGDVARDGASTFRTPFLPQLNEFYRRETWSIGREVRVEMSGLGIIEPVDVEDITIRSIRKRDLVASIFARFGMTAEASEAGRIAERLIAQMGGIQGCRVFKIAGVRELIERYGPLEAFTRSAAIQMIGRNDPTTGLPQFSDFEDLYIEPRDRGVLKPEHAFQFLLKKGVFRTGLKPKCPNCELDFWLDLDLVAAEIKCEYCGMSFNLTPQLRDRDWAYRRSGLFGRENNQEGSIPVAVTVQQLDTALHSDAIFVTSMKICSAGPLLKECEVDLVAIQQRSFGDFVELALVECKTRQQITEADVDNLCRVAEQFPGDIVQVYVVFSKLAAFTSDEVERCRAARDRIGPRIIMLSQRELEPFWTYHRAQKEFDVGGPAVSLRDMARATENIYLYPRPKTNGKKC